MYDTNNYVHINTYTSSPLSSSYIQGKGLIQTLEPLSQGGVAITTAKYETPKHNNINKVCVHMYHVYALYATWSLLVAYYFNHTHLYIYMITPFLL